MYNTPQLRTPSIARPDTKEGKATDPVLDHHWRPDRRPTVVPSSFRNKVSSRSNSRFSMCQLPSEVTLGAMRELGSCEKARTSHNGNSRKFV